MRDLDLEQVLSAFRDREIVPMSDPAATFAHDLLILNARRLRDALI
ncbi:hypothetical protein [Ruania zhangjianzhongii]|nr:hypothetical protein [Ruania zhangjianzhongii]